MASQGSGAPPYRAEHVGSLLRPPELTHAFRAYRQGEIAAERFRQIQDRAIAEVVKLQEDVGLEVVTDGEFRRGSYWSHFVDAVEGLGVKQSLFKFRDDEGNEQDFTAPHVEAKVRRTRGISTEEFAYLDSVTSRTPKITMPSPPTMHFYRGREGIDDGVYADLGELFTDLAAVYRQEIAALAELGARYIQIDEVPLAMLCDADVRERLRARGEDPEALVTTYIDALNWALEDRPQGVTAGMHLCRGNFKGKYLAEGGYESVAERMFNEIAVDVFFLEYDTARAGDFAPLRHVPNPKKVILGLVSSKRPELESADELERRIDQASAFVPLERLGLSPQCGFASTVAGNPVSVEDEANKLRLIVDTARRIWGEA